MGVRFFRRHKLDASRALVPYEDAELAPIDVPVIRIDPGGLRDDPQPAPYIETRTLAREPKLEPDVFVPSLQTVASALAVGLMAGLLAWVFVWSWTVPAVAVALTFGLGWLWSLQAARETLWQTETVSGVPAGTPQAVTPRSYLLANPAAARSQVARETERDEVERKRCELVQFVDICLIGGSRGTSEAYHGVKAGGPARDRFVQKRDTLLELGIACWKNPERHEAGWRIACSRQRARTLIERHVL